MAQSGEASIAARLRADVGLVPRMNSHVGVQVPLLAERLLALRKRTDVRSLPRLRLSSWLGYMCALMNSEPSKAGVLSAAGGTDIRLLPSVS